MRLAMSYLPNAITTVRLILVPVIVLTIHRAEWSAAWWWFALAAFTDFLDGFAARRLGLSSKSGQFYDPVADKVLLMAVMLALAQAGTIPLWFVALVVARDVILLLSSVIGLLFTRYRNYKPSQLGKLSTVLQCLTVIAALSLHRRLGGLWLWPSSLVTFTSGAHYLWRAAIRPTSPPEVASRAH